MGVNTYLYFNKNKNSAFFVYFGPRESCVSSLKSPLDPESWFHHHTDKKGDLNKSPVEK